MKKRKDRFARLLDRLSGTYPNDERISRINEKGFALCGLFYISALAVRSVRVLLNGSLYVNDHLEPAVFAPAVFAVMLLIMAGITVKQRRRETPVQGKEHQRLRPADLPRAAAAFLSGKSPEDERTAEAFERGFAVCALLGFAYYGFCFLFVVWSEYLWSTMAAVCIAPVLLGYVKLRENILTPPRFAHIRLSTKNLLLRLPVYLIAVLPYLWAISFFPTLYDSLGGADGTKIYSESLLIMFFQLVGDGFRDWLRGPWHIASFAWFYAALIYLAVVILHEIIVLYYRKQMQKMDAEENDLS